MVKTRWITAAVVVVGIFLTFVSLALAFFLFLNSVFLTLGYHDDVPPALRATTNLLFWTGLAYLFAAGLAVLGGISRTPIPFLLAGSLLIVAEIGAVQARSHLQQVSPWASLPPWFLPLGIVCPLVALAAAWLLYRPSIDNAITTMVALAVACAVIVLFTARSNAVREASEKVCPHLSSLFVGWIESSLTIPHGQLRAARLQQSTANPSHWFAVAELQGEGFEGDADVAVWRIDAPGASTPRNLEYRADRNRISAVNGLAARVSTVPATLLSAQALAPLDDCTQEVLREVSGW